jgi:hypothetical protein
MIGNTKQSRVNRVWEHKTAGYRVYIKVKYKSRLKTVAITLRQRYLLSPSWSIRFSLHHVYPNLSWGPHRLLYYGYRRRFVELKRPGRCVDYPPPSRAEVKNEYSQTSIHPPFPKETPMACHGAIFMFSMEYFGLSASFLTVSSSCISSWREKNKVQRHSPFSSSSFIAFFIKQHRNICQENYSKAKTINILATEVPNILITTRNTNYTHQ